MCLYQLVYCTIWGACFIDIYRYAWNRYCIHIVPIQDKCNIWADEEKMQSPFLWTQCLVKAAGPYLTFGASIQAPHNVLHLPLRSVSFKHTLLWSTSVKL
ncbi:hypothetical protein FKM82_029236 [Ascaphus truei]